MHLTEGWCENARNGERLGPSGCPGFVMELPAAGGGVVPRLVQQGYLPAG